MGCDYYCLENGTKLHFTEVEDSGSPGCLCTFPHNDGDRLDAERVRSLAYLGAAVVLNNRNDEGDYEYIPHCLPAWIKTEIDRLVPSPPPTPGESREP